MSTKLKKGDLVERTFAKGEEGGDLNREEVKQFFITKITDHGKTAEVERANRSGTVYTASFPVSELKAVKR